MEKYLENLLNASPITSSVNTLPAEVDLPIKIGEYTRTKVELEIKSLNNLKTRGVDFVTCTKAIKHLGERLLDKPSLSLTLWKTT